MKAPRVHGKGRALRIRHCCERERERELNSTRKVYDKMFSEELVVSNRCASGVGRVDVTLRASAIHSHFSDLKVSH